MPRELARKISCVPRTNLHQLGQRRTFLDIKRGGAFSHADFISDASTVTINDEEKYERSPAISPNRLSNETIEGSESTTLEGNFVSNEFKLGGPPPGLLRRTFPMLPWHRLPDWLTYARCIAIPGLMISFYYSSSQGFCSEGFSSCLFAFASLTDWLDGYLARRWEITSSFGAFLDPVADKLMVSTALILLSGRYGKLVAIPASIILAREIAVSALREWMAQKGLRDAVKVGFQGKVKTAATMVALTVLLMVPYNDSKSLSSVLFKTGLLLLYFSTFITVTSGSVYFKAAAPVLLTVHSS